MSFGLEDRKVKGKRDVAGTREGEVGERERASEKEKKGGPVGGRRECEVPEQGKRYFAHSAHRRVLSSTQRGMLALKVNSLAQVIKHKQDNFRTNMVVPPNCSRSSSAE